MSKEYFNSYFAEGLEVFSNLSNLSNLLSEVSTVICSVLQNGHTIYWLGNGGSASDAQHLAAELVGRFEKNRSPIASVALTTDSSILTAIGNDFGFEQIFVRQIGALGKQGDVCVGITTSGKSENVILALKQAKSQGLITVALTGQFIEKISEVADYVISAPSSRTCHIQEAHIAIGQALCGLIEKTLYR